MLQELVRHTRVLDIVGDMIRVRAQNIPLGELATVQNTDGETSLARVVAHATVGVDPTRRDPAELEGRGSERADVADPSEQFGDHPAVGSSPGRVVGESRRDQRSRRFGTRRHAQRSRW